MTRRHLLLSCGALAVSAACVTAPDVVILDRKTALEHQAAGEYRPLENALVRAGVSPRGETFTRGQLEAAGADTSAAKLDAIVRIYGSVQTDAERVDALLIRRCLGEATTGLLVETPEGCAGDVDGAEVGALVQRAGRDRRQLWRYLQEQRPGRSEEEVVRTWRGLHLDNVVCGGQVQAEDGSWTVKEC